LDKVLPYPVNPKLSQSKILNFDHKLATKQEGIKAFRKPVFLIDSLLFFGYFDF